METYISCQVSNSFLSQEMNGFLCTWKPQATASFHIKKLDGYRLFPQSKPDGYSMFLPRKPDEYVHARHYKNETCGCIFTLIGYACPYMQVTSQLFSPAHSPSELAPMHVQPLTLQHLLLVAQALDASCIYTDKFRYFFPRMGLAMNIIMILINWLLYI